MMQGRITSFQIRAARNALRLSVLEVASETGLGSATIKRYEASEGVLSANNRTLSALISFYEAAGIEFIGAPEDGPGLRIWSRS